MLSDGGTVHVRPIRPDDGRRILDFHGRQSPESIYFRYFTPTRASATARSASSPTSTTATAWRSSPWATT